jgi:hypothetical protein
VCVNKKENIRWDALARSRLNKRDNGIKAASLGLQTATLQHQVCSHQLGMASVITPQKVGRFLRCVEPGDSAPETLTRLD